jgi:predicted metalloprotease with PDZ domain
MTEDFDKEDIDELIDQLLEMGVIKLHGFDKTSNDFTYILTPKAKELYPELFEEHFSFINQLAFDLWEKGYIEMKFEDRGPLVMLKDLDYENEVFPHVTTDERFFIENMLYLDDYKDDII